MVHESVWSYFHRRWREIEREWRSGLTFEAAQTPGMFEAIRIGVEAARDELRREVRDVAPHLPGGYLIPV